MSVWISAKGERERWQIRIAQLAPPNGSCGAILQVPERGPNKQFMVSRTSKQQTAHGVCISIRGSMASPECPVRIRSFILDMRTPAISMPFSWTVDGSAACWRRESTNYKTRDNREGSFVVKRKMLTMRRSGWPISHWFPVRIPREC